MYHSITAVLGVALLSTVTNINGCMEYELHKTSEGVEGGEGEGDAGNNPGEYSNSCEDACDSAIESLPSGCDAIACGVDAGNNATDEVGEIMRPGPDGTCELVYSCDPGTCFDLFVACVEDTGSVEGCREDYDACVVQGICEHERNDCKSDVDADYAECMDEATTQPMIDQCEFYWGEGGFWDQACDCEYDNCINGTSIECASMEMMVSPPLQTAAGRWRVEREWLDRQVDRFVSLRSETPTWPVRNAAGDIVSLRVNRIAVADALYAAGLRSNDRITEINDVAVRQWLGENVDDLLALRDTAQVRLSVRRGMNTLTLRYDLVGK